VVVRPEATYHDLGGLSAEEDREMGQRKFIKVIDDTSSAWLEKFPGRTPSRPSTPERGSPTGFVKLLHEAGGQNKGTRRYVGKLKRRIVLETEWETSPPSCRQVGVCK
jgi:hypothetical protein